MDIPMAIGVRQTGDKLVAACTQHLSDDLNIEVTHPSQRKMIKRQRTGNRLMVVGTWRANFSPKAAANFYLKRSWQIDKNL